MLSPAEIKLKTAHLSRQPGVYLMKDGAGKIIYVGKALSLADRILSYFTGVSSKDVKTRSLIQEIADFDVILTTSETEALLLERSLIRHHFPRFNILLKDGKEYPFLRINFKEEWPRIEKVRRVKEDGATYVGPFSQTGYLRQALQSTQELFPLIRCTRSQFKAAKRPCNYYHMGQCLGPCVLPVDKEEYLSLIRDALQFIQGRNKPLLASIRQKMQQAAEEKAFEKAATYRDQLQAIEKIATRQGVVLPSIKDADAIGFVRSLSQPSAVFTVAMLRDGSMVSCEPFTVSIPFQSDAEVIESFLMQYYENRQIPPLILLPETATSLLPNLEVLFSEPANYERISRASSDSRQRTYVEIPKRGDKKRLIDIAHQNGQHALLEQEKLLQTQMHTLLSLKETLGLSVLPKWIECFDISHLQGHHVVASGVAFVDGKPEKTLYRKYNLQFDQDFRNDDFQSLYEVLLRRFRRALEEDEFPDLIVIDGGKGQLSSALRAAKEAGVAERFALISLAKARSGPQARSYERVFIPGRPEALPLQPGSPSFRLLSQLRDESHRFAITAHRAKRSKAMLAT